MIKKQPAHSAGEPVVYMKIKNEKFWFAREARAKYVKNKAKLAFFYMKNWHFWRKKDEF